MTSTQTPAIRDRLLAAARELFYTQGYTVSMDRVVSHARVAKPTAYAHFGSKEALVQAMLEQASDQFFDDLDAEIARRAGDPLGRILAPFDLLIAGLPDPAYRGCVCLNAAATFPEPEHPAHAVLRTLEDRLEALWSKLAQEAGAKRPDALARQLLLLFNGIKARGLIENTGARAEDARAAARILVDHDCPKVA